MNLETAEAFQSEHERAGRIDLEETMSETETDNSHYVAYLSLLEALADGEIIADIVACSECGESADDESHGSLLGELEPNGWHEYVPNNEDAASAVEDYGLGHVEDLLDAINESVLAISVVRRGDLSSAGDIETITLVMGTGGPHDQLNISSNGYVDHEHVEWFRGPGTFERSVPGVYSSLASYLYDLAEELSEQ